MPDQFTETTSKSWGSRIMESIKGIVFGLVLFVVAFGVLYWNEGRVDSSEIAKNAIPIDAAQAPDATLQGKLVAASGKLSSDETLGDGLYLVPGNYITVQRVVEMYAWDEKTESKSSTKVGGSEETQTTYTYTKKWTSVPADSSNFKDPAGHENPAKGLNDNQSFVQNAKVGNLAIDVRDITLPALSDLPLTPGTVQLSEGATLPNQQHIFKGKGTVNEPQIGDLRVSYKVLRPGIDALVLGKLTGSKIIAFVDAEKDNTKLYRMFEGGDLSTAVGQLHGEHNRSLWIFRVLGFLMMWIGLSALFGPISTILDVLPIFGTISRSAISAVTFVISFALTLVTILVSMLLHSLIAVIIAGALVLAAGIAWFVMKKKKAKTAVS